MVNLCRKALNNIVRNQVFYNHLKPGKSLKYIYTFSINNSNITKNSKNRIEKVTTRHLLVQGQRWNHYKKV